MSGSDEPDDAAPFPTVVSVAGWVWGVNGVIGSIVAVLIACNMFGGEFPASEVAATLCGGLGAGVVTAWCGVAAARGKAPDVIWAASASTLLGGLMTIPVLAAVATLPALPLGIVLPVGMVGTSLLTAGLLAFCGRDAYLAWRADKHR